MRDRAYDFNFHAPAVQVPAQQGVLPGEMSVLSVSAPNVVIETVKKAEDSDDIVIRMYEAENKKTECVLHTAFALSGCVETNLMEEPEQELPVDGNTVALSFRPFEIKTVIIRK